MRRRAGQQRRIVLDSSYLFRIWRGEYPVPGGHGRVTSVHTAIEAAQRWLKQAPSDCIILPVRLEFLCGIRQADELSWAEAFLNSFFLLDDGKVLQEDWDFAERLAKRISTRGRNPREDVSARQLGDCLIRAICKRKHADIKTVDEEFPQ
jgi:predicted nucleic acid-binding protein